MTQEQYNVHFQRTRTYHVKIELLNQFDNVIDKIEGISTDGNISLNGDSTYRRTASITLISNNKTLFPSPTSRIWFNRKIRLYVGLSGFDDKIHWFNQGIYLIKSVDIDEKNSSISLDLLDLFSTIDGTFSGTLGNEISILSNGITISEALRVTLSSLGKVSVDEIEIDGLHLQLPYDIEKDVNSTVYDMVKTLIDLYMGWEFFVNRDGWFVVQKIKDTKNDSIAWDFTQNNMNLIIDKSTSFNFDNVKNSIIVWGKKLKNGSQVSWSYKNRFVRNSIIERNNISSKSKGDICHVANENISYYWNGNSWIKLSFNVIPDFSIDRIGERKMAFTSDDIFTEQQAQLRAEYELDKKSNFAETVNINCLSILGLEPNEKIRLSDGDYVVNDISLPLDIGSTMSIKATKLYY